MLEDRYVRQARVVRVVDGDTIDLAIDLGFDVWVRERVRLAGVDAYESRTRDLVEKAKGLRATGFVEQWCAGHGMQVMLHSTNFATGKFGRILGVIYDLSGSDCLNDTLIAEGHATSYFGGKRG